MWQGKPGEPFIQIDLVLATKIADSTGATNDAQRAKALGLHPSVWSRLTNGRRSGVATQDVIAKILTARQDLKFYDIFRVVTR